jgi:hypothetical protein
MFGGLFSASYPLPILCLNLFRVDQLYRMSSATRTTAYPLLVLLTSSTYKNIRRRCRPLVELHETWLGVLAARIFEWQRVERGVGAPRKH